MKRNSLVSLGLIGIMTLAISGCNGFEEQKLPEPSTKGNFVIMVVPETRTEMSENTVVWSADDKLSVFAAENGTTEYGGNVEFTHDSGEKFTGDLTLPSSSNDWYVLYPYNSEITTPANTSAGATRIGSAVGSYQEQNGNNSSEHLAGQYFPLYGKTHAAVPSAQVPAITLNQALSILKVHVTNKTSEPLTVTKVSFTGTEAIAGSFYINFTGENAVMTPVDGSSSNTAILKVKNGTAIAANASADFYLAVKPFTATSGSTLTLAVNGYEKTIELTKDASFKEGKIRTLNYATPTEFPPLLEDWEETALSDINAGDVFVMVGNGSYAIASSSTNVDPAAVPVSVADTKAFTGATLVDEPADNIKWTLSGNNTDGYVFYSYESSTDYLFCKTNAASGSNDNLSVGTGTDVRNHFVLDDGQLRTNDSYVARYIRLNGTSNFRGYVYSTTVSPVTFKFYKYKSEYAKAYAITKDPDINGGTVSTTPSGTQYEGSTVTLTATPAEGYLFTSWDVYKTGESSVKVAVENDQFTMPGYPVTVSAVFGQASLMVGEITPAKAECTDGSVTFTVTSNVEWRASSKSAIIASISPDGTQSPSADPQTVTVTFTDNTGEERTADVYVTPVDEAYSSLARTVTVTQKEYTVIDILNNAWTGITGTNYETKTLSGSASGVTYSVNAAGGNSSIQLRSTSNSGIVTKTSGGIVKKVTVKWNSNTTDARVLDVYGKDTAYSAPSDLYDNSKQGTLVSSFTKSNGDVSYTFETDYEYIGFRSNSGAMYLDEITIEWQTVTKYDVTIDGNITNGTVEASAASVAEGKTVTLTVTPNSGYVLDDLSVYKTGDSSTTVEVTENTFTMPGYDVTVTATFSAAPTISMNKTSILDVPAAGVTDSSESGVYSFHNGATDADVTVTCDGSIVTAASKNNGAITYSVAKNTGAAREGWIKVQYGTEDPHDITVSQLAAVTNSWKETALSSIQAGDIFVIVGSNYAMTNNNGTGSAPATVAVTVTGDEITSVVSDNIKWNVSGNATDGYTFYPNGSTTTWLYCNTTATSSSNNNMRVGATTDSRKVFALNSSNQLETKDSYTKRYLSIYNNSDWRGYTSTSVTNAVCPSIKFYKYTVNDGKSDANISYARSSDQITYGASLTPPTLNGASGFTISCESNNTNVATVNATTGAITVVGNAGTATITVSWVEQEVSSTTYRAGSTSYTLTIDKATPTIDAFSNPETQVDVNGTVTNTTTISNGLTITYTSSDVTVATVNDSGVVTGVSEGSATISATFSGNANFNAATPQSYTITVGNGGGPVPVEVSGLNASWSATSGETTSLASSSGNTSATLTTSNSDNNKVKGFSAGIASQKMSTGSYWLFTIPDVANVKSDTEVTITFSGVKVNNNNYKATYQLEYSWNGTNWTTTGSTYQETTTAVNKSYTFTPGEKASGTLYIRYRVTAGGATNAGSHYLGAITLTAE